MKEKNKTAIIVGVMGIIASAATGIGGAVIGNNHAESQQNQYIESQISNIEGDNNSVTINDVNDLVDEYNNLLFENESLKAKNTSYYNDLTDTKDKLESAEAQISDIPQITYNSLGLVVDVQDVSINKNNSMVTINGRDYFSKEIVEKILPNDKNMTIKDENIYIGQVITDSAKLFEQHIIKNINSEVKTVSKNSFGYEIRNCVELGKGNYRSGEISFSIKEEYSRLKCELYVANSSPDEGTGKVIVAADDVPIYTTDILLEKTSEPIPLDLSINNCNKITIYFVDGNYAGFCCGLADATLYNE